MNEDYKLLDVVESCLKNGCYSAHEACDELRVRLEKLHFYEHVFFNGRDSDDAKRIKPCTNDEREFIKLELEYI